MTQRPSSAWRVTNTITDWEFAEIGRLLCDHAPRDLALMVVRLQTQLEFAIEVSEAGIAASSGVADPDV